MPSTLKRHFALLFAAFFINSCDATEPVQSTQDIGNAIWRSNSSILAFAEQRSGAPSGAFIYKLYEAGADGKLGRKLADEETDEPVPFIATSGDGNTAIIVLRSTLYRLDIPSGAKTQLTTNVTKVYAVSADLKYVLLTHAGRLESVKTVSLLDISAPTVRSVKEWQLRGLLLSQGFWLSGDRIALNLDTVGRPFVSIYDTNGTLIRSFANAQTPARSSAYVEGSNILFVKSFESLEQLDIETGARINISDSYVNLDARGNTLAYIVNEGGKKRIYVRNIDTGETQEVATDAFRFAMLSPDATKLAYLVETRQNYTELKVIPVTTP